MHSVLLQCTDWLNPMESPHTKHNLSSINQINMHRHLIERQVLCSTKVSEIIVFQVDAIGYDAALEVYEALEWCSYIHSLDNLEQILYHPLEKCAITA